MPRGGFLYIFPVWCLNFMDFKLATSTQLGNFISSVLFLNFLFLWEPNYRDVLMWCNRFLRPFLFVQYFFAPFLRLIGFIFFDDISFHSLWWDSFSFIMSVFSSTSLIKTTVAASKSLSANFSIWGHLKGQSFLIILSLENGSGCSFLILLRFLLMVLFCFCFLQKNLLGRLNRKLCVWAVGQVIVQFF